MIKRVNLQRNGREAEELGLDHSQEPRVLVAENKDIVSYGNRGGHLLVYSLLASVFAPMVTVH